LLAKLLEHIHGGLLFSLILRHPHLITYCRLSHHTGHSHARGPTLRHRRSHHLACGVNNIFGYCRILLIRRDHIGQLHEIAQQIGDGAHLGHDESY
jgi:hypothetical protein